MAKSKSQAQSKMQPNTQPKESITNSEKNNIIAKPEKKTRKKKKVSKKNDNALKINPTYLKSLNLQTLN